MIAVYVGLGLLFFLTDIAKETFPAYRKELGATMLIYAGIRLVMTIRKIKREQKDELQD
jgi:hypothetical protein